MEFKNICQPIIDDFEFHHPNLAKRVVYAYPSGQEEMTFKLDDGSKIAFDRISQSIKTVYSPDTYNKPYEVTEDECRMEFALNLKRRMMLCGMSNEDLSELSDISRVSISKYVNGRSLPNIYNLRKLARALKCSVRELTDM